MRPSLAAAARHAAALAVALVVLASALGAAHAATVTALVVYGKSDKRLQALVYGEVERELRAAGWELVPPLSDVESQSVSNCMSQPKPWQCMLFVVNRMKIDRVIAVRVEVESVNAKQTQVALTGQLVLAATSAKLEQARYCGACSDDEVRSYAAQVARMLLDERALLASTTRLDIKSQPMGAEVRIDGQVVGITNNVFPTTPGEHEVEVSLRGFPAQRRTLVAVDGKAVAAELELRASPGGSGSTGEGGGAGLMPKLMVGTGAAAIAAGAVFLFVLDEDKREYATQAEYEADPHYTDWGVPGVATMAAGAALAVTGGILWWRGAKSATKPIVATTSSGVSLGLSATF